LSGITHKKKQAAVVTFFCQHRDTCICLQTLLLLGRADRKQERLRKKSKKGTRGDPLSGITHNLNTENRKTILGGIPGFYHGQGSGIPVMFRGIILIDEGRSYQVYHVISFHKPSFMFRRERLGKRRGSIFRYHTQKETSSGCYFFLPAPRHMYLPPDTFALRSSRPQTGKTKKKK
jgi:hypothetical protein